MALYDPNKKREQGVQIGQLRTIPGTGLDSLLKGTDARMAGYAQRTHEASLARGTNFVNPANPASMQASPSARLATAPQVRTPAVSANGGARSTPTGGAPSSPAVVKPDFSGARSSFLAPPEAQSTGIQRTMVNGVPTFTGTGAFAATPATAPAVQSVQRPTLSNPGIPLVGALGVVNQTEDRAQREARQAALSNIDTQLFLNRGKSTRSARDLTAGLLQTQADLTNTAGNQAVALKNGNLDAQVRLDITGMQNQGENDRAVAFQSGENQRASLLDAGATERERIKLARPQLLTDRDGGYLLLNPAQSVAQPVLANGQQVRGAVEGAITPVDRLVSLQEELKASQTSLTPDPVHIGHLERQIDSLRRPRPVIGDVIDGHRFRGGDPGIAANWERIGGAP